MPPERRLENHQDAPALWDWLSAKITTFFELSRRIFLMPLTDLPRHLRDEHGITAVQENLRQIVYGGNDGIVTTFAIVAGFAGASAEGVIAIGGIAVILFGLANLFADATAMGLGEFLSSRSARDVYRATRRKELELMETHPDGEYAEVVHLLQQRGVANKDALTYADILERNPQLMADFMMRYEFGMDDAEGTNGIREGLFTFGSFLVFGVVPLLPYFWLEPVPATFTLSLVGTFLALAALGLLRWAATREAMLRCIAETVAVGGICAAVAYAVGVLIAG